MTSDAIDWRDLFRRYVVAVMENEGVSFIQDIRPMSAAELSALKAMLEGLGCRRQRDGRAVSELALLDERG